jgi:hypothetical protein
LLFLVCVTLEEIKMDPGFRRDDDHVVFAAGSVGETTLTKRRWVPAFAGTTSLSCAFAGRRI